MNSRPDLLLASIIPETERIRLAPAVSVLPLHHPMSMSPRPGRHSICCRVGASILPVGVATIRREYAPFGADFMKSAEYFEDAMDVILKAWNTGGPWSHKSEFHNIPEMEITPLPVQKPIPFYVASFSKTSLDMAARKGLDIIWAPFAAGMTYGGLDKAVEAYKEACEKYGTKPGRMMCSYFIYIGDKPEEEEYGRARQIAYFNECCLPAFIKKPEEAPPTMQYFLKIVEHHAEDEGRAI